MVKECLFCKIVKGEIPSKKIYEDKNIFSFLDINPVNPGHALVIHKEHSETILDSKEENLAEIMKAIKKLSKVIMKTVKGDGFNILSNNFETSGQIIPHLHFHIIPRFKNDGLRSFERKSQKESEDNIKEIAEKIKSFL